MTSTNDGKEVKNNLIGGPKGKTYYIELYKSLESSLNESLPLPQRTVALCNAWRQLHSLCSHSASSTHPHLLTWIQRHTATTVLQTEWRRDSSLNERQLLENAIDSFIAEANAAIAGRSDVQLSWEKQLVPRAEWFKKLSSDPWGHVVLLRILDQRGEQPNDEEGEINDEEVLEWLKEERGVVFVSRLRQLVASKCDDIALTLATAVMERVRRTDPPNCDDEDEQKPQQDIDKPQTFGDIVRSAAGFTSDVLELLIDIEFVLLDKLEKRKMFIDLAKQTPLKLCYQLAERLRTRLDTSPKEKRLWKNAKHVAITIAQVSIARCMVRPRCVGAARACLYWMARVLARAVGRSALPAAAAVLAAPAASARHLHTFTAALHAECADDMKPFICELYIRAITAGMNELERLKLKTEKENETEARVQEALLASWFVSLGGVLSASARIRAECDLTAFSLHPAPINYERLRNSAPPPMLLQEKLEPKVESVSDFGSWANDSRANTNFVKTSETLNLKINLQQINVVSTAILLEGEALGLSIELCQDLAVLLSGPRVKTFTWEMNREELLANCRAYMERTGGGTKALTTELKYLNLDPSQFQHLPEEYDGEDDMYYGIEKGYEKHLPEPEIEPIPEQIWADSLSDPERHGSIESETEDYYDSKKKTKNLFLDTNDDQDPLSLHTETKNKDVLKKERQHSKERSKKPKARKQSEPKELEVEPSTKEQEDKIKKDQIKKEKKEKRKQDKLAKALALNAHSINELVGVKIDQYDQTVLEGNTLKPYKERKKRTEGAEKKEKKERKGKNYKNSIGVPTADQHGITLMTSPEAGVVFDGLFSMDDLKTISPEKPASGGISNISLNSQTTHMPLPVLYTSAVTETQTSMSLTNPEKKETKEEIKQRIAKLLSFRKQRKEKISQHCANQKLIQQSHTAVTTTLSSTNNLPPAITLTSETNLSEIQTHPQKVDTKHLINQATTSSPNIGHYRSPPNKSVNNIQTQTNPSPLRVQNYINDNSQIKNLPLEPSQGPKPVCAPSAKTIPVNNLSNEPRLESKLLSAKNVPNILQRSYAPKQKTPDQNLQPQSTNSSLNQQKVISMKDFINEIQQSLIDGVKSDLNLSNLTSQQKDKFKQDAMIKSLLNSKVITAPVANSSTGIAPQTTKTSTKQIEGAPNTFSRLSYMHKNKLGTKQTHSEGKPMSQKEAISNELERHIAEFKLAKLQQQNRGSLVVQRGSKKAVEENPVLANMLSPNDKKPNILSRIKNVAQTQPNPYGSGSNMDKELLNLLHQKAILNQTHLKTNAQYNINKKEVQGPCLDDLKVNKSTNLQRVTKPATTEKLQNNNHVLTSLDAHKATATVAKAPQSKKKAAKPKIKQSKAALNRMALLQPQTQKHTIQNVYTNKVDSVMTTSFITKDKLKDPARTEPEQQKQQNWESVMNELLAHKTPSRGPNALNLTLNKIKHTEAKNTAKKMSTVKSSVIANVPMKQTCNLHISHDKSINIKKETCQSPKEHSEIKILKIQNFPIDQFRKYVSKKGKSPNVAKNTEKLVTKPGSKLLLKNTSKPPTTKQIDDEYALLEELIDRDLQQEIDELTSDEESNIPSSDKVPKTTCNLDKELIKVVANQNISRTVTKSNQVIYSNNSQTYSNIDVSKTVQINDHVNANSLQFYRQPNIIVTTPSSYIPIQNSVQNSMQQTYTITNQTSSDVVINVPVNLSNMLLINPSIPCESYAIVQDTYILNRNPNVMLYPNSLSTPVANHTDFQNEVINELPEEAESVEKMNAAESLISMGMPRQVFIDDTTKVNEVNKKQIDDVPEYHVKTAEDNLTPEKFETSTKSFEIAAAASINPYEHINLAQHETNQSKYLKLDILSPTKEKNMACPSNKCESAIEKLDKSYQEAMLKSSPLDLERLRIKRNNLLNRVIHHKSLHKAIPLTYAPLITKSNNENADTHLHNNAISNVLLPNSEVKNSQPTLKKTDELVMENKKTKPCRRILLRSSNSLKPPQPTTTLSTTVTTSEVTENLESGKIQRKRGSNVHIKTLKKSPKIKKKPKRRKEPLKSKIQQPCKNSLNELDFEEAMSTTIIPKTVKELESDHLKITDKSKSLLLADSSESDKITSEELETFKSAPDIHQKKIEFEYPKETYMEGKQNIETAVLDPHDQFMQQNFTTKGVNLQVIRDIFDMDDDSSSISIQSETTNIIKEEIGDCNQINSINKVLDTDDEFSDTHTKTVSPVSLLYKETLESIKSRDVKPTCSPLSNSAEEEYLKSVIVTHLHTKKRGERLEKCVRVRLPNGKSFKVTVSGNTDLDIKSLLSNSDVKSIINSNWHEVKQFKLHVAHNNENSKVLNAQEIKHCPETIDLLSDEEPDKLRETNQMSFRTESGNFIISSIDSSSHKMHQDRLLCKSFVNLIRHPKSFFEKVSQRICQQDSEIETLTPNSVPATSENLATENVIYANQHQESNMVEKVFDQNIKTNTLCVKDDEAKSPTENTKNLEEPIIKLDYAMKKDLNKVENKDSFKSVNYTVDNTQLPCVDLSPNSNILDNVAHKCLENDNQVITIARIKDNKQENTNSNKFEKCAKIFEENVTQLEGTNVKVSSASKVIKIQECDNINKLDELANKRHEKENPEVRSIVEVSSDYNRKENNQNNNINRTDVANESKENQNKDFSSYVNVSSVSKTDENLLPKHYENENQGVILNVDVNCVSKIDATQDISQINTIEEVADNSCKNLKVNYNSDVKDISPLVDNQNNTFDISEQVAFKSHENREVSISVVNEIQGITVTEPDYAKLIRNINVPKPDKNFNNVGSEEITSDIKSFSKKSISEEGDNEITKLKQGTNPEEYLKNKNEKDQIVEETIYLNDSVLTKLVETDSEIISISDADELCEKLDDKVIDVNKKRKENDIESSCLKVMGTNEQKVKSKEEIYPYNVNTTLETKKANEKNEINASVITQKSKINNMANSIEKTDSLIGLVNSNDSLKDIFLQPKMGSVTNEIKDILSPLQSIELLDDEPTTNGSFSVKNKKIDASSSLITDIIELDDSSNEPIDDIIPDLSMILENKLHELKTDLIAPSKLVIDDLKSKLLDDLGVLAKETLAANEPIIIEDLTSDDDKPVKVQRPKSTKARKKAAKARKKAISMSNLVKEARTRKCCIKLIRCDAKLSETILLDDDDDTDECVVQVTTNEINVNIEESDDELTFVDPEPVQRTESPSILNSYWPIPVTPTEILSLSPEPSLFKIESYDGRTSPVMEIYEQLAGMTTSKSPVTILNVPLECSAEWFETKRQILNNRNRTSKESFFIYNVSTLSHLVLQHISQTETLMSLKPKTKICRFRQLNPMKRKIDVSLFASKKSKRAIDKAEIKQIEKYDIELSIAKPTKLSDKEKTLCNQEIIEKPLLIEDHNVTHNKTRVINLDVVETTPSELATGEVQYNKSNLTKKSMMQRAIEISEKDDTPNNNEGFASNIKITTQLQGKCITLVNNIDELEATTNDLLSEKLCVKMYPQLIENHVLEQSFDNSVKLAEIDESLCYQEGLEMNVKITESIENYRMDMSEANPNELLSAINTEETVNLIHELSPVLKINHEKIDEVICSSNTFDMLTETLEMPPIPMRIINDVNLAVSTYKHLTNEYIFEVDVKENDVGFTKSLIQINDVSSVMQDYCKSEWFETKSVLSVNAKNCLKYNYYDHHSKNSLEKDNILSDITEREHNYYSFDPSTSETSNCLLNRNEIINNTTELYINAINSRANTPEVLIDGTFDIDNQSMVSAKYDSQTFVNVCQVDSSEQKDIAKEIYQSIRQDVVETVTTNDNADTFKPKVEACVYNSPRVNDENVKTAIQEVTVETVDLLNPRSVDKTVESPSTKDMVELSESIKACCNVVVSSSQKQSVLNSNVYKINERDKIIANDDLTKSIQIEVSIDYDAEDDKTSLVSPCEAALNTSNEGDDEIKCSTPLSEDGIIIKGIEIEDPLIGTCFVFRPIGDSASETDSICNNDSPVIDSESFNISSESMYEIVNEYEENSQNSIVDSINSPSTLKSDEKEITPNQKLPIPTDNHVEDIHTNYNVIPPKETYFKNTFKRKLGMGDIKIPNKKYRKGKNIDTPKQASYADLNYKKEYKKLMDYVDTLSFSYSIPFHKDYIDVVTTHQNWPIKALESSPFISDDTGTGESMLFVDTQEIKPNKCDPTDQSLDEEMSQNIDYKIEKSIDIQETNFKTGFGEESGRVNQNFTKGGDHSKFSAAALSDVKQNQPILMSGDCKHKCLMKYESSDKVIYSKLTEHLKYMNLRRKVKMFFEKTQKYLYNEEIYKISKGDSYDILKNVPGLYDTDFLVPALGVETVQVVQVGQSPVSAAAQNPVTIDPRVTLVSDASPSQCCGDNSPGSENNESNIKAEYTELTNADLSMVQGLTKQFPLMSQTTQEDVDINAEKSSTSPNFSNIGSPSTESQPNMDNSNNQINMVYQLERNDSEIRVVSQDNVSSSSFMNTTTTTTSQIAQQIESTCSIKGSSDKRDQIAHAMNAAGIAITTEVNSDPIVNVITQNVRPGSTINATTNNYQKTQLNTISLQQALAQILPPQLNQSITSNGNQQNAHNNVGHQVLHIVQGKNTSGNHITLLDNNPQTVLSASNAAQVLHIVQNKPANSGTLSNGTPTIQPNSFGGLSLVDAGVQQGGNQLLHIVNTGSQKGPSTGQILKRVNLLTNLANVQGTNEQKMVQFVCKSADGKALHLNAPHQRGMVLRLQPIENANPAVQAQNSNAPQDEISALNQDNSSQEIKSRSIYEDNYSKYVQDSNLNSSPVPEKATSLPKFNQAFGKPLYQEGITKENEMNNSMLQMTSPETDGKSSENNINIDHVSQLGSPPVLLRKASVPSSTAQTQQNIVQQLKQTMGPMNIQTMHGGVIYTRQIPVNLSGGKTINLITVPTTELIDESGQKQQSEMEPSIIKIVSQSQLQTTATTEGNEENKTTPMTSTESTGQTSQQTQPVLAHMRIKLPMLSKAPQVVSGARVVRPSFFQIQRNIVGGANQQVFQQYVFTTAPQLGQQTIRLPQAQVTRQVKVPADNKSSSESNLSSSTLEQLREFDMVLEQVKERSTVQPGTPNSFAKQQAADVTDSPTIKVGESKQSIIYSIGNNQTVNVAYVTRKPSIITPTTCTFVRSADSTALGSSSTSQKIYSTNDANTSDHMKSKIASKSMKSRPSKPPITSTASTIKVNPIPPKPSTQKPLEDEQTTQRILYILAEYKEQVENSPDKDKPAPRRRTNPPTNPPGSSKRKKGSGGSRRPGCTRDHSPVTGEDACRTMGSEDSSCGTSQGDCTENCSMETTSPQDSPRKVVRKLSFDPETTSVSQSRPVPPRNVIVADGQTITVARSTTPGKPATAVLMPANYILPVSMVKGGQQIAIVTNRGPKLLTVGGATGDGTATNTVLLQRLIGGAAGLKPVLGRPGVRHVRLPTTALQAFNLTPSVASPATTNTLSSSASVPTPDLIQSQASSPWAERDTKADRTSLSENGNWNLQSASETQDYSYDSENATSRSVNDNRTVLEAIPDRYSPDMEAQRIFDKMFEVDTKKSLADSQDQSSRVSHGFDIHTDCDERAYTQVVQRRDGSSHGLHRVAQISSAALRHKYAMIEHELKLQKSLSEECEDLGVDSPSASELFPEAELLFAGSPAAHDDHASASHAVPGQGIHNQPAAAPSRELEDQIAAEHLLAEQDEGPQDLTEVQLSVGGNDSRPGRIDHEEFARAHPNTTFHTEPTDDVTPVQSYTLPTSLKSGHLTSTIFHAGAVPTTVLMSAPHSVIAQTHQDNSLSTVKYSDIDNIINIPAAGHSTEANLAKDDGLTRYDILSDRELHLSNTASAIVHASGTQVIKRVCYEDDKRSFLMDETDIIAGNDAKMAVANEDSRDAALQTIGPDDDRSSPERPELFWESNSASEEKHLDFSSDSDKCCKSPSLDETNSTDSSGIGSHMRLDSVIKEARSRDRSGSVDGSSADDTVHPPLRTYPAKRSFHSEERSLSGKTRAGENPDSPEVRRRSSVRGVVKRGCHCCNGSPTPSRKKPRQKRPNMDYNSN